MSEQYQRVEPTPFDAPGQTTPPPTADLAVGGSRWLYTALGGLIVAALVVIFLLPGWIDNEAPQGASPSPKETSASAPAQQAGATSAPQAGNGEQRSPFADALEAKARAEAQELLAELLDVQENLIERGAEVWATDDMAAVAAEALAGDERYRERDFETAIGHYQQALSAALVLEQAIPERFELQIQAARAAIEALDAETAEASLALAQRLEPGAPESARLAQRLEVLPAVAEAVAQGQAAEATNDLATALEQFRSAATLDESHEFVASESRRLEQALTEQQFNAAMSEGYAALDAANFDRARERFERAARLQTGSSEAAAALQELAVARTADTLKRLQRRGDAAIEEEDWAAAIAIFEEALAIDQSLRFAREGLAKARPRARASKELEAILEAPGRLVDDAILREARTSLERARALDNTGPRMAQLIREADNTLAIASTPLPVSIRSDGATEVTVYKVARLGLFETKELSLRPGQYTAVGSRRGFRDVRVVFEVSPDQTAPVYIACSEAI